MENYGYIEQIAALKIQLEAYSKEIASLRYQRDLARSEVQALLPKAPPQQVQEMRAVMAESVPNALEDLIAELQAGKGRNG